MKKYIAIILVVMVLIPSLVGCNEKNDDVDKANENLIDISKYTVIRPDMCERTTVTAAANLRKQIFEYTSAEVPVTIDVDLDAVEYEILVGRTNRQESIDAYAELSEKKDDKVIMIKTVGNKIILLGKNDNYTALAVRRFILAYVAPSKYKGRLSLERGDMTKIGNSGQVLTVGPDGQVVVLERMSTIFSPDDTNDTEWRSYPKIIKLEHQTDPKNNGVLIATNENTKQNPWSIYRSMDDGETWEVLKPYRNDIAKDASPGYQPYLYELPADVGEYKKGTILFSACVYSPWRTVLILAHSVDLGESWKGISEIAEGGVHNQDRWLKDGIWEPFLQYDEESKRFFCFYSDQSDPKYEQKLAFRYTTDLVNWSKTYSVTGDKEYGVGMVALTKMGNGKWALAFECCKIGGYNLPIHIKYSDHIWEWEVSDLGTEVRTPDGVGLESGPGMAWTPVGGENGVLFLCALDGLDSKTDSKCDLFMSFDYGKSFVAIENPIPVKKTDKHRSSYSPAFFVDKDGCIYYVNNPAPGEEFSCGSLVMTKIRVY